MNKNIDAAFYRRQAHELVSIYEFDKAIVLCKRLITMNPKLYDNHYFWARTRSNQGEYRWSELKFREVIALNPRDHGALNTLGIVFSMQGKYDQAISVFQRALEVCPENRDLPLNLAITFTKKGDYEEAVKWYGKALEVSPSDVSTHNCMGYLYFLQGKFQEAILKFDDAIQNNPRYEIPYFNKAITFFCQSGMKEEYRTAFELGIQALTGDNSQKLHRLKISVKNYNSEINRVRKESERDDLTPDARLNLEKIQKGFEYVLDRLAIEMEKLENDSKFLFEDDLWE